MTLLEYTVEGVYKGFCYRELVADLGLQQEFKSVIGEELESHEYDPTTISEDELIHQVIEQAEEEYILYSDVTGYDERMYYAVLRVDN